ncbi:hypothetical protein [Lentzea nigeriaca]|uniref:hypothetical protein n=1 Tax=Lentzea nigeriaca TaxID=1128665 RepID=UPI001958566F|nr:hypothetical protein [Lentzea nigeriaca]MBM7856907.1 hypothetical protein [Lentzea nigeriaca]
MRCREFTIGFDTKTPRLRPQPRPLRPGKGAVTSTFPYRVSRGEPEVLEIGSSSENCDCRFALVVNWIANGGQKSTTAGEFRVVPR